MKRVKVCVSVYPRDLSQAIHRVARALTTCAPPWAQIVDQPEASDLQVLHVIGFGSMPKVLRRDYAMIQYCLRTSEDPRPEAWATYWGGAKLVWSYYDLPAYHREHGVEVPSGMQFFLAPMGVDPTVFRPRNVPKLYMVGTSGYVAETESVGECVRAAEAVQGRVFHLGPRLEVGRTIWVEGVSDEQLSIYWSSCHYVSGLRRVEGFELPALEGLACGSRAILYDTPDYRRWMGEHAVLIPEGSPEAVVAALTEVFRSKERAVVPEVERQHIVARFDWAVIVREFWERLESTLN